MDTSKLIALGALGSSGAASLSGSILTEGGSRGPGLKLANPFLNFDLKCSANKDNNKENPNPMFSDLDEASQAMKSVQPTTTTFNLATPTQNSDQVQACYRVIFHQAVTPKKDKPNESNWNIAGASIELAASRGKYGILLLNSIGNMKNHGGQINLYRALFLEKGQKWQIKAGVQWSDETFLNGARSSERLKWSEPVAKEKGVAWAKDFTDEVPYEKLVNDHNHPFMYTWKTDDTKEKNIYQEIITQPQQAQTITQDFWNGKDAPLENTSNLSKASAFLDVNSRTWKQTTGTINVSTIKAWFDLFKDGKGVWEKKVG